MDNVDDEGKNGNSIGKNPKRTIQGVSEKAKNINSSKVTGLETSKADGNASVKNMAKRYSKMNMVRN